MGKEPAGDKALEKGLEDKLVRLLELAGYTEYESRALAALVLRGDATPSIVATRAKVPKGKVYDVLEALEQKSLVFQVTHGTKRYRAIRPEELVPLVMKKAQDMESIKSEIGQFLIEVYEGAQEVGPGPDIEALVQVLAGKGARGSSLLGAFKSAKQEILIVDGDFSWAVPGTSLGDQLRAVASKARLLATAVVPKDHLIAFEANQMPMRSTSNIASTFVVVDRRDVWFNVTGASDGPACIHVDQKTLGEDMARLFNQAWESAKAVTTK